MTRKLDLVSSGTAAHILDVPHSFVTKLCEKGRLKRIPIEGAPAAYHRAEIERVAVEIAQERSQWNGKRGRFRVNV